MPSLPDKALELTIAYDFSNKILKVTINNIGRLPVLFPDNFVYLVCYKSAVQGSLQISEKGETIQMEPMTRSGMSWVIPGEPIIRTYPLKYETLEEGDTIFAQLDGIVIRKEASFQVKFPEGDNRFYWETSIKSPAVKIEKSPGAMRAQAIANQE